MFNIHLNFHLISTLPPVLKYNVSNFVPFSNTVEDHKKKKRIKNPYIRIAFDLDPRSSDRLSNLKKKTKQREDDDVLCRQISRKKKKRAHRIENRRLATKAKRQHARNFI